MAGIERDAIFGSMLPLRHAPVEADQEFRYRSSEVNVLENRQVRRKRQFLIYDGDAGALGARRINDGRWLAINPDLAARIGEVAPASTFIKVELPVPFSPITTCT